MDETKEKEGVMQQTNRTILFEQLNPHKENLTDILGLSEESESLSDDDMSMVEQMFVVHNFEEVMTKFDPAVSIAIDLEQFRYYFPVHRVGGMEGMTISLNRQNHLLRMFEQMLDYKLTGDIPAYKISGLGEYILPRQDLEGFIELRRRVKELFLKGRRADAGELLLQTQKLWGNALLHIQLIIEEGRALTKCATVSDDFIRIEEKEEMQIRIVCRSSRFEQMDPFVPEEDAEELALFLKSILEHCSAKGSDLMLLNFLSVTQAMKRDSGKYIDTYNRALQLYGELIGGFNRKVRPLFQTLLGIRAFFAQYRDTGGRMQPSVLITNLEPSEMMDAKKMKLLRVYLETANQKNTFAHTVWYAILPRIEDAGAKNIRHMRERFAGNKDKAGDIVNETDVVLTLASILSEYRIQMFMSIETRDETAFPSFARDGMDSFYQGFGFLQKVQAAEYYIPCYPNFRMLLKEQAKATPGVSLRLDDFDETVVHAGETKQIWLEALYIDAAYVAAGLAAAYQCPDYLSHFYKKNIDFELPGVSYRIMERDNRYRTATIMAKEICGYSQELTEQIIKRGYGIIFACEQQGVTVLTDKTLALMSGNAISIAHVQTLTYLERIIRSMTQDYKDTLIKQFFINRQDNMLHKWMQNKKMINSLFRDGETIQYQIDEKEGTCRFEVVFNESRIESKVQLSR